MRIMAICLQAVFEDLKAALQEAHPSGPDTTVLIMGAGCGGLSWIETYCGIFTYPPDLKAYSSLVSRSNPDNGKMVSSRILLSQAYHLHLNINFHNPFVITFAFVAALGCREVVELGNPLGRGMYLIEF
ncbi:uncharacterized protein [Euphorbia lathyris]|uniref:uncharacterized protein isoform X1 n=1 Tax=Euphorbia lathyris TaxID=212925 RepID=UPI0033143E48